MTYRKKNIFNKHSITKKCAWSLILEAKQVISDANILTKSISISKLINNNLYKYSYSLEKNKVIRKNFNLDAELQNLFDLYMPIIFNGKNNPYLIAHIAQTLDGYIATKSGESKYISSPNNLEHIHMLRAISDVIIVGTNTVKLDNPMLTTRLVKGLSPMRLILDKGNVLKNNYNVFSNRDGNGYKIISDKIKNYSNNVFILPLYKNKFDLNDIISLLRKLNKKIIYIEGGGSTVSNFYNNKLLNKMHLCISPIIIGQGHSSFILPKIKSLKNIKDNKIKYFKMGEDILCDIDLSIS
jgi:riboflavin-specific deaminase-like protein